MASGSGLIDVTKALEEYRLPTDVKPSHYDVTIRTDLDKLKFDGFVIAQYVADIMALSTEPDTDQSRCTEGYNYARLQHREATVSQWCACDVFGPKTRSCPDNQRLQLR